MEWNWSEGAASSLSAWCSSDSLGSASAHSGCLPFPRAAVPKLSTHTAVFFSFLFFFYCFITRLSYQHAQSHMLAHILHIHGGKYLIHMHFILLCQIHLIPSLRTDLEYQQLYPNSLKNCSLERERAEKSELRAQPQVTGGRHCLSAVQHHENPLPSPRHSPWNPLVPEKAECDKHPVRAQGTNGPAIL